MKDNREIALEIILAHDWDEVKDLVDYVDSEYLHLEKDENGYFTGEWERAIEDWCDDQLNGGMLIRGGRQITQEDMYEIARYMDDDIREELHLRMAPCSPEAFIWAYLQKDSGFRDLLEETFQWTEA